MPDREHERILRQGADAWNSWREGEFYVRPNLREVNLDGLDISDYFLAEADLTRVNLRGRNLAGKELHQTDLTEAKLDGSVLTDTDLTGANLFRADLIKANLEGAHLQAADFRQAYLMGANLKRTYLGGANLTQAALTNADLSGATLNGTIFGENYLDDVEGLTSVTHDGPSVIGIETIYRSKGNIHVEFLRGCGVPEDFIAYSLSLSPKATNFYSCFISYSSVDDEFAKRLYADLRAHGVRVWFAPEDMRTGDKIRDKIDASIYQYDKLLLILSEHSVMSDWVGNEVEAAFERESKEKTTVLFPIKIDDAIVKSTTGWAATIRRTRHTGDFTHWRKQGSYAQALERLLRDLQAERW